ncbi:TrfB-related DNA-binding protein [Pseudomonas sp. MIL19]|uniref:TrfB-related DNA-binding protein n=1 Tax=Pseudomonas sp. MIL19 TaxID=2976979 RepID=UPI00236443EC|nr:TrfB-related DNA-binding protein [Pseudomonas sp. MIL19]MDD2162651.1 TrfB-related DNA-binding protein [Pseudomonas sp. MIL19]
MKKRLTEAEFQAALAGLDVGHQTMEIARGVLVQGRSQSEFVEALNLSKGAVSQAVNRIWAAHEARVPPGCERLTVLLPKHQAFIVKKWASEFARKREAKA